VRARRREEEKGKPGFFVLLQHAFKLFQRPGRPPLPSQYFTFFDLCLSFFSLFSFLSFFFFPLAGGGGARTISWNSSSSSYADPAASLSLSPELVESLSLSSDAEAGCEWWKLSQLRREKERERSEPRREQASRRARQCVRWEGSQ
jgi:hypothetical protein